MNKTRKKYENKKTLKVNKENNIDSIIELFQKFGKKYNIITTTLEPNIQYQTKNMKITQTYTKTILETNTEKMTKQLENKGKITLIIIDNMKNKNTIVDKKITKLNQIKNVKTRIIKEKDTFNTIDEIVGGNIK